MKPYIVSRRYLAVLTLAAAAMPLSAAADVDRPIERTFKVAAGSVVTVRISGGSIAVEEGPSGSVKVVLRHRVHGAATEKEADELLADYDVELRQDGDQVLATARGHRSNRNEWRKGVSFSATLTVPRDVRLDLNTSGGGIGVRGDRIAALDAHTSGGAINVDGGRAPMTLETSGGGITIRNALSTVVASTSGGSISVDRVGENASDVELDTSGGHIRVGVDPRAKLTVRATTSGGHVSVTDLPFVSTRTSTRTRSNDARGTINGGGRGRLDAHTSGGSIDIRSSR